MNYRLLWVAIATVQLRAFAYEEAPLAPPVVDTSTESAVTIDNWSPKPVPKPASDRAPEVPPDVVGKTPPVPVPAVAPSPTPPVSPSAVVPAAVVPAAIPPREAMNKMTGTISSIDEDAKTIRLSVDGGVTPEFDYDDQTVVLADGTRLKISDLQRDDEIVVRYVGKDLIAREIDRLKKAPR